MIGGWRKDRIMAYECEKVKKLTEERNELAKKLASHADSIYKYKFEADKWNVVIMDGYIIVAKKDAFEIETSMKEEFAETLWDGYK